MASKPLRAVVVGTGWAGQGHAGALRATGVELVGLGGRTESMVRKIAAELAIPECSTDPVGLIGRLRPDIVAIGTPANTHLELVEAAFAAGADVLCEKPLTTNAAGARQLYDSARAGRRKTAYASTARYAPTIVHAHKLIADGAIGRVLEVECISHYGMSPLLPFCWFHALDTGGGRLNNNFTHKLGVLTFVLDATVLSATGETRNDLKRAPVGEPIHDFRAMFPELAHSANLDTQVISREAAERGEWRSSDADWSYTVLMRMGAPGTPPAEGVSVLAKHSAHRVSVEEDHITFLGEEGTLSLRGAYGQRGIRLRKTDRFVDVELPPDPMTAHVDAPTAHAVSNSAVSANWVKLVGDFVADVRGEPSRPYPTFHEGWLCQEIIGIVRRGDAIPIRVDLE